MASLDRAFHSHHLAYLLGELLMVAWAASVQRAKPYIVSKDRPPTAQFRHDLLAFVEQELLQYYREGCSEEQHIANLVRLTQFGTQRGQGLFDDAGYRLGVAQKFLNTLLKTLWCLGFIVEPPHCPVDRVIIEKLSGPVDINWSEITTVDEYLRAISSMKSDAALHQLSIAEWELQHFERRNPLALAQFLVSLQSNEGSEG
ncbi:hypothetical protein P9281_02250 [Caballeronia sp. LP003]|uniref:hypothetical protein n=1 Tax=Caballeronia sp. LP003 TaxID=3038551 RepID=UPI0028656951|nr:hypothetical protein [Caballeronia sp. LP003]MDR5785377.1 hypothetical protein [Caballeronia sp. LP003]